MNRNTFDLYWWACHYTHEIEMICEKNLRLRDMGLLTEERLQKSNEDLYKNMAYRQNILNIISADEEDD